jgi:hypothetical protein
VKRFEELVCPLLWKITHPGPSDVEALIYALFPNVPPLSEAKSDIFPELLALATGLTRSSHILNAKAERRPGTFKIDRLSAALRILQWATIRSGIFPDESIAFLTSVLP